MRVLGFVSCQVSLLVPVCYLLFWALLLGFSLHSEPLVCGVGLVIMLTGVPVYFLGVYWKDKPKCIYDFIGKDTRCAICIHYRYSKNYSKNIYKKF